MVPTHEEDPEASAAACELLDKGVGSLAVGAETMGLIERVYTEAGRFFSLEEPERALAALPCDCGYLAFGREYSDDPGRPDRMDAFVASPRVQAIASALPNDRGNELHAVMMHAFNALERCAEEVALNIAERVGGGSSFAHLRGAFRRWSRLEVHRAHHIASGELINDAHEDGHLLTFAHASAPGLEIEKSGRYTRPDRRRGAMIVMPGSALTLLTGGAIAPLRHRFVSDGCEDLRFSVLFFADLDPRHCQAWRSSPINDGVDIGAHVRSNVGRFGVADFAPE